MGGVDLQGLLGPLPQLSVVKRVIFGETSPGSKSPWIERGHLSILGSGGCPLQRCTDGTVKAWKVCESSCQPLWSTSVAAGSWVRKMVTVDSEVGHGSGCLVVCHSEGVAWLDPRQRDKVIGKLEGCGQAHAACVVGAQRLVLSLGRQLALLDLRLGHEVLADFQATLCRWRFFPSCLAGEICWPG